MEDKKQTLKEKLRRLPTTPGVYLMKDRFGQIIYIGKAVNLKRRVSHYFQSTARQKAYSPKNAAMIASIADFEYMQARSEAEALMLESKLIKRWKPRYNTLERDDKNFLLLRVETFKPLPRFTFCRHAKEDGALYYGPYLNTKSIYSTINQLKKDFGIISSDAKPQKLPDGKWRLYDDARAEIFSASNIVSEEEYAVRVKKSLEFLNNQTGEIIEELEEKMLLASQNEDFEKAAKMRDAIWAISQTSKLREIKKDPSRTSKAVAERALVELSRALGMKKKPHAMECFDISHMSGSFTVASMVHFDEGLPANNKYRRFKMHVENNDYAAMEEVVGRRYGRLFEEKKPMPNLVVIDGGKGQVKSALEAFEKRGITPPKVIGLAKREETIVCSDFDEIKLPRENEGLKLLQRIRDEAHRFANAYRETLQRKKIRESVLDDFEGLGQKRKDALLKYFGSIAALRKAQTKELEEVEGIGSETARRLREFLDKLPSPED
ncbi:MAG: excinuclease ABC subunit UvrC [Opitutales bacterium]|nr:excinuclease ABC subunit UvrC [Opitutales bacterium]